MRRGSLTCFLYLSSMKTDVLLGKIKLGFLQSQSESRHSSSWYSCSHFQPFCAPFTAKLAKCTELSTAKLNLESLLMTADWTQSGKNSVISVLKACFLNFPPSFLCKRGLMTSLHLYLCDLDGSNSWLHACDSPLHLFKLLPCSAFPNNSILKMPCGWDRTSL